MNAAVASHCRIRRVRMKGGADLTVLRRPANGEISSTLVRHARDISAAFDHDLAGFFVIGWGHDAAYSAGSRLPNDGPITLSLLPSWLAEIARREIVTSQQIRDVIAAEYEVKPPRPPAG